MMGHQWERGLPRPPRRADVLRETILRHIRWYQMRPVPEIHQYVVEDYGDVTDRTIYRHLKVLLNNGEIVRVSDDCEETVGYVRANRPRWDNAQQVWV